MLGKSAPGGRRATGERTWHIRGAPGHISCRGANSEWVDREQRGGQEPNAGVPGGHGRLWILFQACWENHCRVFNAEGILPKDLINSTPVML